MLQCGVTPAHQTTVGPISKHLLNVIKMVGLAPDTLTNMAAPSMDMQHLVVVASTGFHKGNCNIHSLGDRSCVIVVANTCALEERFPVTSAVTSCC